MAEAAGPQLVPLDFPAVSDDMLQVQYSENESMAAADKKVAYTAAEFVELVCPLAQSVERSKKKTQN